jgi:aryl-alcohol dehydrogenase-like predicted oxidoreductase
LEGYVETRKIGSLEVSVVALGCNNFGGGYEQALVDEVVHAALDAGITYFDTAEGYGRGMSEEVVGRALKDRRAGVVVATKYDGRPEEARAHAEASLQRLGVDCIDLYTLHHPVADVPVAETLDALSELATEGLIREFGCSNVGVAQLEEAAAAVGNGRKGFVSVQNDYNLLNRKMELTVLPYCASTGLAFTAYFPIYHGFLTGHFQRGGELKPGSRLATSHPKRQAAAFTDEHFDVLEGLTLFAEARGRTVLDVALGRLLAEPGLAAVLPGAASAAHVRANANASTMKLSAEDIAEIDAIAPTVADSPDTPSSENGYPV